MQTPQSGVTQYPISNTLTALLHMKCADHGPQKALAQAQADPEIAASCRLQQMAEQTATA
jgi:hypothetical protein